MANVKHKKFGEDNPDIRAIRKYQQEIEALQEKYDKANCEHDWSMRHFYGNQIQAKKANMGLLLDKLRRRYTNADY